MLRELPILGDLLIDSRVSAIAVARLRVSNSSPPAGTRSAARRSCEGIGIAT